MSGGGAGGILQERQERCCRAAVLFSTEVEGSSTEACTRQLEHVVSGHCYSQTPTTARLLEGNPHRRLQKSLSAADILVIANLIHVLIATSGCQSYVATLFVPKIDFNVRCNIVLKAFNFVTVSSFFIR
jgi:hypothetical protein